MFQEYCPEDLIIRKQQQQLLDWLGTLNLAMKEPSLDSRYKGSSYANQDSVFVEVF